VKYSRVSSYHIFILTLYLQLPKVSAYLNVLRSIPALSTAAAFQKQPEATGDAHKNIKALHDKPADANVWQSMLPQYLQIFKARFPTSYVVSLIKV
jgi:hypothetical protein